MVTMCQKLAQLDLKHIEAAIPNVEIIGPGIAGGQKAVFPCKTNGIKCALKLVPLPKSTDEANGIEMDEETTAILGRLDREFAIMSKCNSLHLAKLAPGPCSSASVDGQPVIYYSEEWIDGETVATLLKKMRPFPLIMAVTLALHIVRAISELWYQGKIHRDIKPANIMRRAGKNVFVLVDYGLAFDLAGSSYSRNGPVGTYPWFSPEQFNFSLRRQLDFRSDLFALGIVLYECLTGTHPFYQLGMDSSETAERISRFHPLPPMSINKNVPASLSALVMTFIAKQPHMRPSRCTKLIQELEELLSEIGR